MTKKSDIIDLFKKDNFCWKTIEAHLKTMTKEEEESLLINNAKKYEFNIFHYLVANKHKFKSRKKITNKYIKNRLPSYDYTSANKDVFLFFKMPLKEQKDFLNHLRTVIGKKEKEEVIYTLFRVEHEIDRNILNLKEDDLIFLLSSINDPTIRNRIRHNIKYSIELARIRAKNFTKDIIRLKKFKSIAKKYGYDIEYKYELLNPTSIKAKNLPKIIDLFGYWDGNKSLLHLISEENPSLIVSLNKKYLTLLNKKNYRGYLPSEKLDIYHKGSTKFLDIFISRRSISQTERYNTYAEIISYNNLYRNDFRKFPKKIIQEILSDSFLKFISKRKLRNGLKKFILENFPKKNLPKEYILAVYNSTCGHISRDYYHNTINNDDWKILTDTLDLNPKHYKYLSESKLITLLDIKNDHRTRFLYKKFLFHKKTQIKASPKILENSKTAAQLSLLTQENYDLIQKYQGKELIGKMFGYQGKRFNAFSFEKIFRLDSLNPYLVNIFSVLLKDLNFNYDIVLNFIEQNFEHILQRQEFSKRYIDTIKQLMTHLKEIYPEERCLKLLFIQDVDAYGWNSMPYKDTLFQLLKIKENDIKDFPKKPKSLVQLHNQLSFICRLLEEKEFVIAQGEIDKLDGMEIEGMNIFIPKSNKDLITIGILMNICVGDGGYAESIVKGDIYIIALKKEGRFSVCVEIDSKSFKILQIKGVNNSNVSPNLEKSLQKMLQKTQKNQLNKKGLLREEVGI